VRNPHDYLDDFRLEVACYLHVYDVLEAVDGAVRDCVSAADNLVRAYEALASAKIVDKNELDLLHLWLKDLGI
jgi:hypothetical protein